jgi:hypothetical protein
MPALSPDEVVLLFADRPTRSVEHRIEQDAPISLVHPRHTTDIMSERIFWRIARGSPSQ